MSGRLIVASSIAEARAAREAGAAYIAGGSWVMRAPVRGETVSGDHVALTRVGELSRIDISGDRLTIGAAVTHDAIAGTLAGMPEFGGLAAAAGKSANPAIRRVATLGGNLCTIGFAAADLVPALLALDAEVTFVATNGLQQMPVERFLAQRHALLPDALVTAVHLRRAPRLSGHARLPMRKAGGDYPIAIVSVSLGSGNGERHVSLAVGSVEPTARRWTCLEAALDALSVLSPEAGAEAARAFLGDFAPRNGIEAPGWYRVEVLPVLVRRALALAMPGEESD